MSSSQKERQEIEEAAVILLQMADPLWTRPTDDDDDDKKKGGDEDEKERDESEKEYEKEGDEDDDQVSIAQPSRSASSRATMTPAQRARFGYNTYSDLDITGTSTGIMYMTPAERRTYRQTQRRRGAALVRAATTKGSKSKRGGAGGRKGPRGGAGGASGPFSSN